MIFALGTTGGSGTRIGDTLSAGAGARSQIFHERNDAPAILVRHVTEVVDVVGDAFRVVPREDGRPRESRRGENQRKHADQHNARHEEMMSWARRLVNGGQTARATGCRAHDRGEVEPKSPSASSQ
jgi:hypothetical protein